MTAAAKKPFQIRVGLDITGNWQERPLDFLAELTKCTQGLVENLEASAVSVARAQGASWADIGTVLGISRQAAWERFSGDE